MGNRILSAAHVPLELRTTDDLRTRLPPPNAAAPSSSSPRAIQALQAHLWPGNFRELEATLERALLLYRSGPRLGAEQVHAALAPPVSR